jgi:hypothetical protein
VEKIRIPILVQDPSFWESTGIDSTVFPPIEGAEFERPFFQDGPQTDLVEVSDAEVAVYERGQGKIGGFRDSAGKDILKELRKSIKVDDRKKIIELLYSPTFILVSTFACVLRTLSLFERKNILGRPIQWEFSPSPLICQPRLDEAKSDARYHRESKRIYFGASKDVSHPDRTVYFSLSREAVAHETAHAILDGINPHLYNSLNPHARALHESLADLSALLVAIKSDALKKYVLGLSSGSLDGENAFSQFAENIGAVLHGGKKDALRSFVNDEKLAHPITDAYLASTVLSGAIWDVIRGLHASHRDELARTKYKDKPNPQYSASGEPLDSLTRRLRTLLYRALDYLPGGYITLADYGRALLLVDKIQFGPGTRIAESLEDAFRRRNIFKSDLASQVDEDPEQYPHLLAGGWAAMLERVEVRLDFIQNARSWLGIPGKLKFDRLTVEVREISSPIPQAKNDFIEVVSFRTQPTGILRILWNEKVDNIQDGKLSKLAPKRAKLIGTTVIIDAVEDRILARLSNASPTEGLYQEAALRIDRQKEIQAHNDETGKYLERCSLKIDSADDKKIQLMSNTGRVVKDTLVFSGHGLSLHGDEYPMIGIASASS